MTIDIDDAISALLAYRQADMEGVEVLTSRQAIHEVADELRRMRTLAQQPGMREALERALWELTDLARPICSVFNRSTKKYEFDDEHVAKALPSTFAVIQQIRTALAAQPPAAPVDQERLAELQNEAGMYKSLYENAIAQRSSAATTHDLSCAADFLDDIEVDENGKCEWTAVANAQTHIRAALRCWAATEPQTLSNPEGGK